jgi:hypothetical protein
LQLSTRILEEKWKNKIEQETIEVLNLRNYNLICAPKGTFNFQDGASDATGTSIAVVVRIHHFEN